MDFPQKKEQNLKYQLLLKEHRISAQNNSTPAMSTPALSRTGSLNNIKQIIVATQTSDDDQTPSVSWIILQKLM